MSEKTVNIQDARKHFSRLIALVEQGERIVITRAGKPVAELQPLRKGVARHVPVDDPLLRVNEYSYDGPVGPVSNVDIDRTVCK